MVLVPELIKGLSAYYPKITPIYYWLSREGGNMSRESFKDRPIKLLVLYARRPKVKQPGCGTIEIKLNQLLFERARLYEKEGFPVIAGFPLADKLEDLVIGAKCVWLKVNSAETESILDINLSETTELDKTALSFPEIFNLVSSSQTFTWEAAIKRINAVRHSSLSERGYYQFLSGDLYKPVYFLIHQ